MFFISNAYAQAAPAVAAGPGLEDMIKSFGLMAVVFVVFYLFVIRPQVKRQKEQKSLVAALSKGDEVLTAGGIIGKITDISEQYMTLQISSVNGQTVEVAVQRAAVQTILPKGTMKSI